jgi:hypothetical protein
LCKKSDNIIRFDGIYHLPEEFRDPLRMAADGVEETGEAQAQDGAHEEEQKDQLVSKLKS